MLVPKNKIGSLSGLGWAVGYIGGMISLIFSLAFLSTNPETGRTLLGFLPAFGLDTAAREGDRAMGPLTAIWFVIFVTPLFLFTPDGKARPTTSARRSSTGCRRLLDDRPRRRDGIAICGYFLLANMIYTDGLIALFAFGGIYGAGTFGWHTIELGLFGILLTITGTIGAYVGGKLDDRLGAKTVVLGSLVVLVILLLRDSVGEPRSDFVLPAGGAAAAGRRNVREHRRAALCRARRPDRHGRRARCRPPRARCWCGSRRTTGWRSSSVCSRSPASSPRSWDRSSSPR